MEERGCRALVVKINAHNVSPFSEANEGALGTLHMKKVSLEQELEDLDECTEAPLCEELRSKIAEINIEYDAIRRAQEHYILVHVHIAAYISQWAGLSQVMSQTVLLFIVYQPITVLVV